MNTLNGKRLFVGVIAIAVVAAVVGGLIMTGSPEAERMRRADQQRINDLQQISYAVDAYWNRVQALPASLDDLAKNPDVYLQNIRDPRTTQPYEFRSTGAQSYELCATFDADSTSGPDHPIAATETFWTHGPGHRCYALDARSQTSGILKPLTPPVTP